MAADSEFMPSSSPGTIENHQVLDMQAIGRNNEGCLDRINQTMSSASDAYLQQLRERTPEMISRIVREHTPERRLESDQLMSRWMGKKEHVATVEKGTQTRKTSFTTASLDRRNHHGNNRAVMVRKCDLKSSTSRPNRKSFDDCQRWIAKRDPEFQMMANSLKMAVNKRKLSCKNSRRNNRKSGNHSVHVQCSNFDDHMPYWLSVNSCEIIANKQVLKNSASMDELKTQQASHNPPLDMMVSKMLPMQRTLLDRLHKQFCSDQYANRRACSIDRLGLISSGRNCCSEHDPFFLEGGHCSLDRRQLSGEFMHLPLACQRVTPCEDICSELMRNHSALQRLRRGSTSRPPQIITNGILDQGLERRKREKELAEIEATEACKWLRATGFPQYGQMFEDGLFPISIESVRKDHDFLDADSFQTLCRRLNTLNRCAQLRVDTSNRKAPEDSDEEDEHCALSDKWQYLHSSRRWSRLGLDVDPSHDDLSPVKCSTSHDSLLADQETFSLSGDSPVLDASPRLLKSECLPESLDHSYHSEKKQATSNLSFISPRLRRAASERFNSARNILRRADTKGKYKKSGMDYLQISNPVVLDKENMKEKIRHLNCVDLGADVQASQKTVQNAHLVPLCMTKSLPDPWLDNEAQSSPQNASSLLLFGDSSSACFSTPPSHISDDSDTLVDSTLQRNNLSPQHRSENNLTEVYFLPADHKPGSFPKVICNGYIETGEGHGINYRTGSFSLGRDTSRMGKQEKQVPQNETQEKVKQNRTSMYDNVPDDEDLKSAQHELDIILHELFQNIHGLSQALGEDPIYPGNDGTCLNSEGGKDLDHSREDDVQDAPSVESSQENSDQEQEDHDDHVGGRERRDSGVGSSLTRVPSVKKRTRIRWHSFQKCHRPSFNSQTAQICSLSAGQLMVLHKLCLLKLTGLIEKYSPANRSGWNWGVPRFIKRQKEPDYRNRNVFGVPLLVTLRRTGQPLPQCILYAMRYLRRTAKHAVGIFRKSGVRSRIQRLRDEIEANPELVDFKEMQAYDVADLVKQYFRELPECLLTNKLSETFINIFTHVPADCRLEAVQSAIILMPDENREVLQSLLLFLSDISQHASEHQMTASNLAVCFAPSLFNIGNIGKMGHSPRRSRKNLGVPDPKELLDQKAAHECLMFMIRECKRLFTIPLDTFTKCRFSYMEQGDPVSLDEFNKKEDNKPDFESWVDSCIQGLLKESREKFRCWISVATTNGIDVAYKKVGDGHPLRLWMCSAEVEAPPVEVLNRIMIERHQWDEDLLSWGIVEKLDHQTDVFQFVRNSMAPHPSRDICMLRSWRTNLPKGACVLVSTSIEHPSAKLVGGVRGVVLASRYLIEYCDSGKSRVTHISRVDTRGRSAEWYNKAYGHICANFMRHIQNSFRQKTDGPETKV